MLKEVNGVAGTLPEVCGDTEGHHSPTPLEPSHPSLHQPPSLDSESLWCGLCLPFPLAEQKPESVAGHASG